MLVPAGRPPCVGARRPSGQKLPAPFEHRLGENSPLSSDRVSEKTASLYDPASDFSVAARAIILFTVVEYAEHGAILRPHLRDAWTAANVQHDHQWRAGDEYRQLRQHCDGRVG